jgi:hypothetical protein
VEVHGILVHAQHLAHLRIIANGEVQAAVLVNVACHVDAAKEGTLVAGEAVTGGSGLFCVRCVCAVSVDSD